MMLITTVLERAIKEYMQLDPETCVRLAALSGKVVKMEFSGWKTALFLFPDAQGIRLQNYYEGPVDAEIKGQPISLLRAGLARGEAATPMAGDITISGDVEIAHTLSRIMQQIQIDWEELLSHILGDVWAHQVGNVARGVKRWRQTISGSMRQNITDYLQEERRYLPPRKEIEDFFTDVSTLRNDVDRLAVSITYLLGKRTA
jgi:ubiquinone biosynthesis protein UbiJ